MVAMPLYRLGFSLGCAALFKDRWFMQRTYGILDKGFGLSFRLAATHKSVFNGICQTRKTVHQKGTTLSEIDKCWYASSN